MYDVVALGELLIDFILSKMAAVSTAIRCLKQIRAERRVTCRQCWRDWVIRLLLSVRWAMTLLGGC